MRRTLPLAARVMPVQGDLVVSAGQGHAEVRRSHDGDSQR